MKKAIEHLIMATDISVALCSTQDSSLKCGYVLLTLGGLQIFPLLNRWVKGVWNLLRLTQVELELKSSYVSVWGNPVVFACDFKSGRFCFPKKQYLKIQNILKDDHWILGFPISGNILTSDFFFFLAMLCRMWNLSPLTRDWPCDPCSGSVES